MVGKRLRELRKALGYKEQTDFAKVFPKDKKITQVKISRYESEMNRMNSEFLNLLFEEFNTNINWLLTGYGKMFIDRENPKEDIYQVEVIDNYRDNKQLKEEKIKNILSRLDSIKDNKLLDYIDAKVIEIVKKYELGL